LTFLSIAAQGRACYNFALMSEAPRLSVIVPLCNESANVAPLAQKICAAVENQPGGFELLLVDDASTDDTWQQILTLWRSDSRIRALRHSRNAGQSAALFTGFRACRGQILATLDGDLQNDPADLPRLLSELEGCDAVCGVRTKRADNLVRKISSRLARMARKLVLRVDFVDSGCNLRVFKRSVLDSIPAFDGIHRFLPILANNTGARVKQVPVTHHPRIAGRTKYGVWNRLGRGVRDLFMVRWFMQRQIRPQPVEEPAPRSREEKVAES
jgi:dolichol-phosphate mannosyltransferase